MVQGQHDFFLNIKFFAFQVLITLIFIHEKNNFLQTVSLAIKKKNI